MYSFFPLTHRVGIIDLGSNSARLMIAQYAPGQVFKITDEVSRRVRLSERMSLDRRLHTAALIRAFDTIQMFRSFCQAQEIGHVIPVATAAVRDASNGQEFLAQVKEATDLSFRTLSGTEEAYYGAIGVINGLGLSDGLALDIGGGSAQVSLVQGRRFMQGDTSPLGAVYTTEQFLLSDPVRPEEITALKHHIEQTFSKWPWMTLQKGGMFTGLGGTIRALARIDRMTQGYPLELVHGYELRLRRIEKLIDKLAAMPISMRAKQTPGLSQDRADIILAGAMIVAGAMRRAATKKLIVCGQGIREGLLYQEFLQPADPPLIDDLRAFSVLNMARLYGYAKAHTTQVAKLALSMFDQTVSLHGYGEIEREYLWAATQLHDIGTVVDYYDHHKHSAYIVSGAGLPGYTHRETIIITQLCLYHRKGKPDLTGYNSLLKSGDEEMINKLTSLLRLAEYLDRSRAQTVEALRLDVVSPQALLRVKARPGAEVRVEIWEAQQSVHLFEQAFGLTLEIEEE